MSISGPGLRYLPRWAENTNATKQKHAAARNITCPADSLFFKSSTAKNRANNNGTSEAVSRIHGTLSLAHDTGIGSGNRLAIRMYSPSLSNTHTPYMQPIMLP